MASHKARMSVTRWLSWCCNSISCKVWDYVWIMRPGPFIAPCYVVAQFAVDHTRTPTKLLTVGSNFCAAFYKGIISLKDPSKIPRRWTNFFPLKYLNSISQAQYTYLIIINQFINLQLAKSSEDKMEAWIEKLQRMRTEKIQANPEYFKKLLNIGSKSDIWYNKSKPGKIPNTSTRKLLIIGSKSGIWFKDTGHYW